MNTIVATYLVRVTLREGIEEGEGRRPADIPTNDELVEIITAALHERLWDVTAHVTSERTDQ
jgi:hypothetical protein